MSLEYFPPPYHTTFPARGYSAPQWSSFKPWGPGKLTTIYRDKDSNGHVPCIAWSCDGQKLASCGHENMLKLWSPEKSVEVRSAMSLSGSVGVPSSVAWNPTHPDLLCSVSNIVKKIAFWDTRQTKPTQVLSTPHHSVSVQYSPDGKTVLGLDNGDEAFFFHFAKKEGEDSKEEWAIGREESPASGISEALFSHSGEAIFLALAGDGSVKTVGYPSLEQWDKLGCHIGGCYTIDLHPRGRYLATGGADSIINIWDLTEWISVRTVSTTDSSIQVIRFSHDGEWIASATDSSYIDIIATETAQLAHRVDFPGSAACVAWHPSKNVFAASGDHGSNPRQGWINFFGPAL